MELVEITYKAPIKKFNGKFQESLSRIKNRPYMGIGDIGSFITTYHKIGNVRLGTSSRGVGS